MKVEKYLWKFVQSGWSGLVVHVHGWARGPYCFHANATKLDPLFRPTKFPSIFNTFITITTPPTTLITVLPRFTKILQKSRRRIQLLKSFHFTCLSERKSRLFYDLLRYARPGWVVIHIDSGYHQCKNMIQIVDPHFCLIRYAVY